MTKRHRIALAFTGGMLLLPGCSQSQKSADSTYVKPPLFSGMGPHHREVTTTSRACQRYFDQGLNWAYAFNHDEAIRSFTEAARLDPQCAMAWWGVALCHGPHINNPVVTPEHAKEAWIALQKALAFKHDASALERALIEALAARYADPQPDDRAPLDKAYADAMRGVWEKYANDTDVGTLYAEAMMDLRPWDLWKKDGSAQPGSEKILSVLEDVMRLDPYNPGANHLYIHAVEASPHPERANDAADRLRDLVPVSGHLLHMPSHIDVLTGRWRQAIKQNELAIRADARYRKRSPHQGFYRLYMLHNHHMLAFAAMMSGRYEEALTAARDVVSSVPPSYRRENAAFVDAYMGPVYDVLQRFGKWDELLAEPPPPEELPITNALWRMHRGIAYAAKGNIQAAEQEKAAFEYASAAVPEDAIMAINRAHDVLNVAAKMLDGEIELGRGDLDASIAHLRDAVELEDQLRYMEPPEWAQPVRHTLGAVLLKAERYAEAEKVYRQDLENWPNNGWSLYGLARSLRDQGKTKEARKTERQFRKAWSRSDSPIESSCACVSES